MFSVGDNVIYLLSFRGPRGRTLSSINLKNKDQCRV